MSYCRVWLLVGIQNRVFRQAVAIARSGAAGSGAAALVAHYGGMKAAAAALGQKLRALLDELAPPDG